VAAVPQERDEMKNLAATTTQNDGVGGRSSRSLRLRVRVLSAESPGCRFSGAAPFVVKGAGFPQPTASVPALVRRCREFRSKCGAAVFSAARVPTRTAALKLGLGPQLSVATRSTNQRPLPATTNPVILSRSGGQVCLFVPLPRDGRHGAKNLLLFHRRRGACLPATPVLSPTSPNALK
jgi:hypothetical protein